VLVVGSAATGLFLACSSDQTSRNRDTTGSSSSGPGAGGSDNSTTTGLLTGPGAGGGINPTTGSGGAGGSGPPPLTPCDPPGMPCPMGKICVKAPMGMSGGVCSPNGGPCDPMHDTCGNDQYCCGAGCRIDGSNDPVCVSGGSRPINTMCNTKAVIGAFAPDLQCEWKGPAASDPVPTSSHVLVSPLVADLPVNSGTAAEIIVVTSAKPGGSDMMDGSGVNGGVIRILNGQTCKLEETLDLMPRVRDTATPAIAD